MVFVGEGIGTFDYIVGFFHPRKFKSLFLRILNWSANESKTLFVVRPITIRKGVGGVAMESDG